MPSQKREAADQLSKQANQETDIDLEFEDTLDDEFSDASLQLEEEQDNDDELDDAAIDRGILSY